MIFCIKHIKEIMKWIMRTETMY